MKESSQQFFDRAVSIAFAVGIAFVLVSIGCVGLVVAYRLATAPCFAVSDADLERAK